MQEQQKGNKWPEEEGAGGEACFFIRRKVGEAHFTERREGAVDNERKKLMEA